MVSKVWFITGTSKGFGRVWAEAALARGDRVAATARDVRTLAPLVERFGDRVSATTLDVTDKRAVEPPCCRGPGRFGGEARALATALPRRRQGHLGFGSGPGAWKRQIAASMIGVYQGELDGIALILAGRVKSPAVEE